MRRSSEAADRRSADKSRRMQRLASQSSAGGLDFRESVETLFLRDAKSCKLHHRPEAGAVLFESVNRQSAEQFGIEIGGFLRQHLTRKRDVANLLHAHWIHEERDVCSAISHAG